MPQPPVALDRDVVERLAIISPPDGATYLIDPTLRPEFRSWRSARRPPSAVWSGR